MVLLEEFSDEVSPPSGALCDGRGREAGMLFSSRERGAEWYLALGHASGRDFVDALQVWPHGIFPTLGGERPFSRDLCKAFSGGGPQILHAGAYGRFAGIS